MRRKVIKHGSSTLTVSLPSKWAKRYDIKKGDELIIDEVGKDLVIRTENTSKTEPCEFDTKNNKRLGKSYLTSKYRSGHDQITLKFADPSYIDSIQDLILHDLQGFEIISQQSNSCTVSDLMGGSKDEINIALRRTWLLILNLADDELKGLKKKDQSILANVVLRDKSVNRFSNYCLRMLNKNAKLEQSKLLPLYVFITNLEEISDNYKDLARSSLDLNINLTTKELQIFDIVNANLRKLYETFYSFEPNAVEELYSKIKEVERTLFNNKRGSPYLNVHLLRISELIKSQISLIVQLQL